MRKMFLLALLSVSAVLFAGQPKYVFYFIGDGMGQNQVLMTEMYLAELEGKIDRSQLCFTSFPVSGQCITFSKSNGITDSSAAGTALASGEKTKNGTLGLRPDGTPVHTGAERLHEAGWGVGITTSVSIDHATPGAFYAHVDKRNEYYKIGTQLAASGFDFFGGATFYQPHLLIDKKKDLWDTTTVSLYKLCRESGYTFAHGFTEYQNLKSDAKKMILIQPEEGLTDDYKGTGMIPYRIDRTFEDLSLTQITEAAIDFLSSRHERFFLMVEGGAIDWACHSNDAATVLNDVIDFDEAIRIAYEFYLQHKDETLIVVTADHETGGLGLGNSDYTLNLQILQNQKMSLFEMTNTLKSLQAEFGKNIKWQMVKDTLRELFGLYDTVEVSKEEDKYMQQLFKQMTKGRQRNVKTLYKEINGLADYAMRIICRQSKLGWTTGAHSAAAVGVWAVGVGAEQFTGWQDNTQLVPKIMQAVGE